jgi:hypothetical protein
MKLRNSDKAKLKAYLDDLYYSTYNILINDDVSEVVDTAKLKDLIYDALFTFDFHKNLKRIERLYELLKNRQKELFPEVIINFAEVLIQYYFYFEEDNKIEKIYSDMMEYPLENIRGFVTCFWLLHYYQQTDLIEKILEKNFQEIRNFEDLEIDADYCLAYTKFQLDIQKYKSLDEFDRDAFSKSLENFCYVFNEEEFINFEDAYFNPELNVDELNGLFLKDAAGSLQRINGYFARYMKEKGFNYYLSSHIFRFLTGNIRDLSDQDFSSINEFFYVNENFEETIESKVYDMKYMENDSEIVLIIWGGVYLYDFLLSRDLINHDTYNHFIELSNEFKGGVIYEVFKDLWKYNFVHKWEKPDSISESEFQAESSIFRRSYYCFDLDEEEIQEEFSEEFSKLGDAQRFIIKDTLKNYYNHNNTDDYDDDDFEDDDDDDFYPDRHLEPEIRKPKIGRNEPCPCGSGKKYKKCCGK